MSLKEKYLSVKVQPVKVHHSVWGDVLVRQLSVGEVRSFAKLSQDEVADIMLRAVVDEEGNPVFNCLAEIDSVPLSVVKELVDAIMNANTPDVDAAKKP